LFWLAVYSETFNKITIAAWEGFDCFSFAYPRMCVVPPT